MDWAESSIIPLSKYLVVPRLMHPDAWKEWANSIIQVNKIAAFGPPQPDRFDNWRDWAHHFNLAVPA